MKQKPKRRKRKHTSATKKKLVEVVRSEDYRRRPWKGVDMTVTPRIAKDNGKHIDL